MKKKILIIAEDAKSLILTRKELLIAMQKAGYSCDVLIPQDRYCNELVEYGCRVVNVSFGRRTTNPFAEIDLLWKYIRYLKKNRYNLVITYSIKPNIYGGMACRLFRIPYFLNITGMGSALNNEGIIRQIVLFLYHRVSPKATGVFFENKGNQKQFIKWNLCTKANSYVFNGAGINLSEFKYSPQTKKGSTIIFTYIGRLMTDKGINELCQAAKLINQKYSNVRFRLIGEFDDIFKKVFYRDYANLDNVDYLGYQENIKQYIRETDCIILPSYHEGMANVLLEGGAIGRPLLASDIHGCRETIIDGVNGFLFRPRDIESLVCAIEKFIHLSDDMRICFGEQSRKHIENSFNREVIVNKIIEIIKKY